MSENVMATGVMVPISRKLSVDERDEISELLWERGSNVQFNSEATIAFTEIRCEPYGISFGYMSEISFDDFEILAEFNIELIPTKARSYVCYYYNGVDSDMSSMKLEDFLTVTSQ